MSHHTPEEAIEKLKTLAKVLREELGRERSMTQQELTAVQEAIRVQTMHRDKFLEEQKNQHQKERKPHL